MAKRTSAPKFKRHFSLQTWLMRHLQMALSSLGRLSRTPTTTAMTTLVIGIALSLPAGLNLIVNNFHELTATWQGSANISLFLNQEITDKQAEDISRLVRDREDVASIDLLTKQQALDEFRERSGLGDALDMLDDNPLPAVILVQPSDPRIDATTASLLAQSLEKYKEIDLAQVDLQWVNRLEAITTMVERGITVIALLLAMAVTLIIGNTIRLEIQNRHDEIEVTKLVGATNGFIRRPFLYEGIWYGLIGAVIALLLVIISLLLMSGPISELAGLYDSGFDIASLSGSVYFYLLIGSPALGLTGAWISVNHHLGKVQPE